MAFFASLTVYFKKPRVNYLQWFPFFLAISFIIQTIGSYMARHGMHNVGLYAFNVPFEFTFYLYTLYLIVQYKVAKKVVIGLIILFLVLAAINLLFIQTAKVFNTMTYALGCLLVVAVSIYYFYELFQLPEPVNVAKLPGFWICAGLVFYHACSFPIFGLLNFMHSAPLIIRENLGLIIDLLNVFLYSSFTIAFLCRIRARNSTS